MKRKESTLKRWILLTDFSHILHTSSRYVCMQFCQQTKLHLVKSLILLYCCEVFSGCNLEYFYDKISFGQASCYLSSIHQLWIAIDTSHMKFEYLHYLIPLNVFTTVSKFKSKYTKGFFFKQNQRGFRMPEILCLLISNVLVLPLITHFIF